MLDAGGGGGGTPWESMTIQAMQTLIQNPDTEKHWNLVTGWKRSAELVNEHRFQVQDYRDNLAAAWPPEHSKASAAYLARLDALILSLKETYEAALANYDAFSTATLSLSLAQTDMQKIFDEYQANDQLLIDFNAKQQEQKASGIPQPSPSPSGEQPPVAPGRQEELRQKAVTLLQGVSTELAQAQIRLVTPTPYRPARVRDDLSPAEGGPYVAPPIPPIVAGFPKVSESSRSTKAPAPFPTTPNTAHPGIGVPGAGSQQPGLILGGTNPTVVSPPSTGPTPPAPPLAPPPSVTPTTGLLPSPNPLLPNSGGNFNSPPPSTSGSRGSIPPREGLPRTTTSAVGGVHAMPPGGLIGGNPVMGLGQPGPTRPATRRVNPIGGLIGGSGGQNNGIGRGVSTSDQFGAHGAAYQQAANRKRDTHDQAGKRWDPDNPWEITEGVDPVVRPAQEQRIDPGPAIGLR